MPSELRQGPRLPHTRRRWGQGSGMRCMTAQAVSQPLLGNDCVLRLLFPSSEPFGKPVLSEVEVLRIDSAKDLGRTGQAICTHSLFTRCLNKSAVLFPPTRPHKFCSWGHIPQALCQSGTPTLDTPKGFQDSHLTHRSVICSIVDA